VNVFPLTDGASALVVLVNMLDRPETVKVALLRHANSSETWLCRNVTGAERREGKPELEVDLAAYGTALVWFAPLDGEEAIEGRIAQAREALARWREAGADTGPLEPFEHALDHPEGHRELRLKAGCAADRLLASLALSAEASWEAGALVASCRVYPPEGGPLGGARVLADLTPGSGERLPLEPQGGGRYELRLGSEELPRFYDLETGDYRPVSGPVRVTFEAAHGASRGGAFAVAGRE
jgi:hypothetical protein